MVITWEAEAREGKATYSRISDEEAHKVVAEGLADEWLSRCWYCTVGREEFVLYLEAGRAAEVRPGKAGGGEGRQVEIKTSRVTGSSSGYWENGSVAFELAEPLAGVRSGVLSRSVPLDVQGAYRSDKWPAALHDGAVAGEPGQAVGGCTPGKSARTL